MKKSSGPLRAAIILAIVAVVAATALGIAGCGSGTSGKNIPDAAAATKNATKWADALSKNGLTDTLNGTGPFVAFVSSNAAVDKAGASALTADVQKAMIVPAVDGKVPSDADLHAGLKSASMLANNDVTTYTGSDGKFYMNAMAVTEGPITAKNGVIYVVEGLVTPK
jgi:uncharacterized surface protein with fasciclin (FAS1) repeats